MLNKNFAVSKVDWFVVVVKIPFFNVKCTQRQENLKLIQKLAGNFNLMLGKN